MNEWISVECENPSEWDAYFVTWKTDDCGPFIGICEYKIEGKEKKWLVDRMEQAVSYRNIKIIAWMDARPYKED